MQRDVCSFTAMGLYHVSWKISKNAFEGYLYSCSRVYSRSSSFSTLHSDSLIATRQSLPDIVLISRTRGLAEKEMCVIMRPDVFRTNITYLTDQQCIVLNKLFARNTSGLIITHQRCI
jgi:hypothetical protein